MSMKGVSPKGDCLGGGESAEGTEPPAFPQKGKARDSGLSRRPIPAACSTVSPARTARKDAGEIGRKEET